MKYKIIIRYEDDISEIKHDDLVIALEEYKDIAIHNFGISQEPFTILYLEFWADNEQWLSIWYKNDDLYYMYNFTSDENKDVISTINSIQESAKVIVDKIRKNNSKKYVPGFFLSKCKFGIDEMVDVKIPRDGIKRVRGCNQYGTHKNFQVIFIRPRDGIQLNRLYGDGTDEIYYTVIGYPKGKETAIYYVPERFLIKRYPTKVMYYDLQKHELESDEWRISDKGIKGIDRPKFNVGQTVKYTIYNSADPYDTTMWLTFKIITRRITDAGKWIYLSNRKLDKKWYNEDELEEISNEN